MCYTYFTLANDPHALCRSLADDAIAALTVASVSIPQSISFATSLAKSSPLAGLVRLPFNIVAQAYRSDVTQISNSRPRHNLCSPWDLPSPKRGSWSASELTHGSGDVEHTEQSS